MTIMNSGQLKHSQQEKRCKNFHENFDLNVTAQELEDEPDLLCESTENYYSRCGELSGTTEKPADNRGMETNKHEDLMPQANTFEGCVDDLLILAQSSAEILAAQSGDSVAKTHINTQNQDLECSQELLDGLSSVSHVSSERCGLSYEVTGTRLTQIRKQARCKYRLSDQDRAKDNRRSHLQTKTIRLSQIKHQARCKSKNFLSPQRMSEPTNEQRQGKTLRLSQMKHQARSKNNATVKEGTEEHNSVNQHCNGYRVKQDNENHNKECQCAARRLRSFKTKKLRQQLSTGCVRTSSETRLQASGTLLKDKDLITCQQELPQTFGCTKNLEANFGTNKLKGHYGSNESSGLRYTSLQHIPSGLPVQKKVLLFTGLPNYTFHQYGPNMGWMSYMHHVQLKEYHRVVARQHRAERIEEKRALKYKQQKSKNPLLANSEAQTEKLHLPVKGLRLTQLKRDVRIGNQCSSMQGFDEN